ncbi:helix-turn-helix domain-containing protein [Bacillus toyonensis]|uniref:helix-turn-helix domain-containing protein n=1 Tax=Bacillus toyonensis TaxID=155322 RepID=UPI000BF22199|nr:AraC family transcriptional regulator [Bacillus toyonensis]MDF9450277.1 AraC family transcriptional regulator [Bacillus toyonensis]MDG1565162.1 AraC family transcriptional regulator [Bacillus toyonensis]PEO61632.1 AraC family transcriptional regulator [Bacillus toyonensis]PFX78044.1 AraC family transcriptional regulator [Bacillus toyonensis]PGB08901.1 AraC family transcriptional regulator [Bacillus toyonensis]
MNEYIQQMIDWIEKNLRKEFSLEKLSHYMGYSPYYCSFKFHQATGVSIRRYVLLRRLYLSTEELTNGRKIIDIAMDYDYSSQEAYGRAFKTVFGITPKNFQLNKMPIQSFVKLNINKEEEFKMNISRKIEVEQLRNRKCELFDKDVLNILNGQFMYEEFKNEKLMGESDYAPFNEAMCVNATSTQVFDEEFIEVRARGHNSSVENYIKKVIDPLEKFFKNNYECIVLWFGEDMFCQMNLVTILSYLEQSGYEGRVILNSFREDEFKVSQTELKLGNYCSVYKEVLVNHRKPSVDLLPVMYQAIKLYLEMLKEDNAVTKFIYKNKELSNQELLIKLFHLFHAIGYGDSQYIELINKIKKKAAPKI